MIGEAAGEPRALDGIEADAAAADDDDAGAGFDAGRVDDRAQPVSTPQAMSAALSSGHVLRDRDRLRLVDDHVLGEGAGAQAMDDRLAGAVVQRGRAVEREHFLAEDGRALGAGGAEAAIADERRHHVVADFQPGHARADRLDHARRLMAVDRRQFAAPGAVEVENVAVADRAGRRPDQHFARPGLGEFDRLDRSRARRRRGRRRLSFSCGRIPAEWRDLEDAAQSRARGESSSALLWREAIIFVGACARALPRRTRAPTGGAPYPLAGLENRAAGLCARPNLFKALDALLPKSAPGSRASDSAIRQEIKAEATKAAPRATPQRAAANAPAAGHQRTPDGEGAGQAVVKRTPSPRPGRGQVGRRPRRTE